MTKKIGSILSTIILILLLLLVAVLYIPKVFGITPMVVLSGSMEPTYHVGSLIFVEKSDPASLEVDDKVTFYFDQTTTVVTHRIIEKNEEQKSFVTKGDNNNTKDPGELAYTNVIGKAMDFSIPYLGYLSTYLSTTIGFITVIIIAAITLLFSMVFGGKKKQKGVA